MVTSLPLQIRTQPTDSTCGPSCLDAVYRYWDLRVDTTQLFADIQQLPGGGTLAVHLAIDALRRGLLTTITTFNLQLFDPTWFEHQSESYFRQFLIDKLAGQLEAKKRDAFVDWHRMESSTQAYTQYLNLGGRIRMSPLDERLIARPLSKDRHLVPPTYCCQWAGQSLESGIPQEESRYG